MGFITMIFPPWWYHPTVANLSHCFSGLSNHASGSVLSNPNRKTGWKKSCLHQRICSLHPRKLTWNLKMTVSNGNLLFQGFIFRFHVSGVYPLFYSVLASQHGAGLLPSTVYYWQRGGTWRIIPFSKWLVTSMYNPFRPFGMGITLLRGLTIHGY